MNAVMWARAKQLLAEALEQPEAERERYVVDHCADPKLRRDVLSMLAAPAPLSDIAAAGAAKLSAYLRSEVGSPTNGVNMFGSPQVRTSGAKL